ncbi:hypothetical protein CANARDRAFT_7025 [[Candida] arabinofermentans NRRL YB-2248]|uniref:NADPH-dependent diflavin oxidoreductase 1 n=1 Tax=[Candida] arabinofermentans NRRL YB-2248 TaxID=983967 RepID=A0A1E4T469_9ASCO|nr:hypothetical protein CANARDRAFT_7025 [[Candida] arabinofermentans NRRL YB-2248]
MVPNKRSIAILYGSETGNSLDFAYVLSRKCRYLRFDTTVSSLDDFDLKQLLYINILIVVCSTTGQGEIPRNGQKFWKFMLKKKLPNDLLNNVKFSSLGLGDSSYPKYNYAIKKIHARLLQLGAKEFSPRAESDEQSPEGSDAVYLAWETSLLSNLNTLYPLPNNEFSIDPDTLLPPINKVVVDTNKSEKVTHDQINSIALDRDISTTSSKLINVTVSSNDRITSDDHFQDVRNLILKDPKGSLRFQPCDTVSLYPTNDPKDVDELIRIQQWEEIADYPLTIEGKLPSVEGGLVRTLTLRSLLTHHIDIMSIPRRSFFMLAWHFAKDELERDKLKELSTIEESEQLYDYANRPRRSILEVIQEFFTLSIPIEYILEVFPIIKPRLFSISSGPNPSVVELTVAIVEYKTIIRRIRKGVCTRWIKELNVGDQISISINRNNVSFGSNEEPLIMVGPGTGIAPMKALVEETISKGSKREMFLFSGNRFSTKDFLYGDFFTKLSVSNKLNLFTSFSREKGGYVQDTLYANKVKINDLLLNKGALIYLCGSSGKMPIQVRITIETILSEVNQWSEEKAKAFLVDLENKNRYIQETW